VSTALKNRVIEILSRLKKERPVAHCELTYHNPFELLIAVILSAQCTDERVNKVTPALFKKYPIPEAIAKAPISDLENLIRSTGFYKNKAKNIKAASELIVKKFGGKVPRTMEELLTLPGVARKTANVVLGEAFGIPSGFVVDTHVARVSQRLGLTKEENPEKIEKDLMALIPKEEWIYASHAILLHGRYVCKARNPKCLSCVLADLCPSYKLFMKNYLGNHKALKKFS
jgi:endonuclease-3